MRPTGLLILILLFAPQAACPGQIDPGVGPGSGGAAGDGSGTAGTGGGAAAGTGGSAGGGGGGGRTLAMGCANATMILTDHCIRCHTGPPQIIYANLDLQSANPGPRLVGRAAYTGASGECAGQGYLLDPTGLPATGILIDKINSMPMCGMSMPVADPPDPLGAADLDCLQAWANGLVAGTN